MTQQTIQPDEIERDAKAFDGDTDASYIGCLSEQELGEMVGGFVPEDALQKRYTLDSPKKVKCGKCGATFYVNGDYKSVTCPKCGAKC